MGAYRLYTVVPYLIKFLDSLTNVYVRYNRKRMKGSGGKEDSLMALASLYNVLLEVCKVGRCVGSVECGVWIAESSAAIASLLLPSSFLQVMAPFTPFLAETMYQNLVKCMPEGKAHPSVHFCTFPTEQPPLPGDQASCRE